MSIEESIQQINELIEAWELNEAYLNQTDIDAIKCLLKQNKELKQKYLNAVADYETTMFEKEQLKKQLEEKNKPQIFIDTQDIEERYAEGLYQDYLEEENKKIKKQLTTYQILHRDCKVDNLKNISKIEEMENQQKKFIKYLEDEIKLQEEINDIVLATGFEEILQKYKETIGDDK